MSHFEVLEVKVSIQAFEEGDTIQLITMTLKPKDEKPSRRKDPGSLNQSLEERRLACASPEEHRDADCVARLGLPRMLAPAPGHNGPRAFAFGRCSLGLDKREHSRKEISATCLKNQV